MSIARVRNVGPLVGLLVVGRTVGTEVGCLLAVEMAAL